MQDWDKITRFSLETPKRVIGKQYRPDQLP